MRQNKLNKRELLRWSGGLIVGLLGTRSAFAQQGRGLAAMLPPEVRSLIDSRLLGYAEIAEGLVRLERDADRRGLPASPLRFDKRLPLTDLADQLYRIALPRLVALIDRSERVDPGFADRAGGLLAQLHQSQYRMPEALIGAPQGFDGTVLLGSQPAPFGVPSLSVAPHLDDTNPAFGLPSAVPDADEPDVYSAPDDPAPYVAPPPVAQPTPPAAPAIAAPPAKPAPPPPLSRTRDFATLAPEYARMFGDIVLRTQYSDSVDWHLSMIRAARTRYESVGSQVAVPWHFIAVIHGLEASFNFRAHLHNGDFPLSARTRQVPAGRPLTWLPPADWESSAKDALRLLGFTGKSDWTLPRTLYRLEAYNGFGYRRLSVPSPYLWSFSNQYEAGKFVSDGSFNAKARSQQCGAAVMLKLLADAGDIAL